MRSFIIYSLFKAIVNKMFLKNKTPKTHSVEFKLWYQTILDISQRINKDKNTKGL